jgi:predicted 3-demethylubiquinone-9 3-methyltransferase (glyoxalase superfamily)
MAEQKIIPNLWFDTQAEEAAAYYIDVLGSGRVTHVMRYPEGSPGEAGSVMAVYFEAGGMQFVGINGGPQFPFTEAVSLQVNCADQAEVDRYWDRLIADGGAEVQCGWLKDKYGLSWQIVPEGMEELFADPDPSRAQRAMQAMLQMKKLDVEALRAAADGVSVG